MQDKSTINEPFSKLRVNCVGSACRASAPTPWAATGSFEIGSNIVCYLRSAASSFPGRAALVQPDGKGVTFKELWEKVCLVSAGLKSSGLHPGERMVVMIPMSIDLYTVLLAIIKTGGVAVFVDPWMPIRKIAEFAAFAKPVGFAGILKSHLLRIFEPSLRCLPLTITTGIRIGSLPARHSLVSLLDFEPDLDIWEPPSEDSPALITFTSGSSGTPKGANRTHGFLAAQYDALHCEFEYPAEDVDMPMFPVFALRNLADGITSVIPDMDFRHVAKVDARRIIRQMRRHGVNNCTASPPFVQRLAEAVLSGEEAPAISRLLTGGAPVANKELEKWRKAFPDTEITIVYGSTEAEPVASITLEDRLKLKGEGCCIGHPVDAVSAKIIRIVRGPIEFSGWENIEKPLGEVGELAVQGKHVCRDYFQNPDAVRENKITDNNGDCWHRMGDTGYLDHEGRFWLVGRVHSTITCKGEPMHAQTIETKIASIVPHARKVAVIQKGGRLFAVIEGKGSPGSKTTLQSAGIPVDEVVFTRRPLPLDPRHNSKIDYEKLAKKLPGSNK